MVAFLFSLTFLRKPRARHSYTTSLSLSISAWPLPVFHLFGLCGAALAVCNRSPFSDFLGFFRLFVVSGVSFVSFFQIAYSGYHGEIPSWEMGYKRERDVEIPNLRSLLKGRAPGPVRVYVCVFLFTGVVLLERLVYTVITGVSPLQTVSHPPLPQYLFRLEA